MAYGMSAAKEAGLAQTQVWKRLMSMPVDQLKAAAHGEVPGVDMNLATLALRAKMTQVADQGVQAQQQLAQTGQGSVKERLMAHADQLPEMLGIGRLPAQNMEAMAAAQGGVVGYADGGSVEHYQVGGGVVPEGYEMFEDPVTGEMYPRKKGSGFGPALGRGYDAVAGFFDRATTPGYKKTPEWYAQNTPAPVASTAPTAPPAVEPVKAPEGVKKALASVARPKAVVENPTETQKSNLDKTIENTDKLYSYIDKKFGSQLDPIKDQLAKDREEYKNMKSENVGLALLGAAGALLKPGRSTASAIGEGLGTLAEYGTKFQPQLLAARQGISAGEIGLAQAQAQAARGNFGTAAQMIGQDEARALQERELAAKEPLYKAQAQYYGAKAGEAGVGGSSAGLANLKATQSNLQAQLKALQGKVDPQSVAQAKQIQMQLQQIGELMAQRSGVSLNTGFISKPGAGMGVTRSSLFDAE